MSSTIAAMISASVTVAISSTASRAIASGSAPTNGGVMPSASVLGRGGGAGFELDRDDPHARRAGLDRRGHAAQQAAAADRDDHRIEIGRVVEDLEPDGPGAGEHDRI